MSRRETIVLITNIPNQYRLPLFEELSIQLDDRGFELHVVFGALSYAERKTILNLNDCKFKFTILETKKWSFLENDKGFLVYEGLASVLYKLNPVQIILSGFSLATIKVIFSFRYRDIPLFLWSGTISNNDGIVGRLKSLQRKWLLKRVKGILCYSHTSKEYFKSFGINESMIHVVGNTVDVSFFKEETSRLKKLHKFEGTYQLTYVGYLSKRKAVGQLLYMFRHLLDLRSDVRLVIVGSGDEMDNLVEITNSLKIEDKVTFTGFVQKELIPSFLAKSDLFLFQTNFDIWGLVLNEAMAAGVPCIASTNAVSTIELIRDGVNGFQVNFDEGQKVAEIIDTVIGDSNKLSAITKNAQDIMMKSYSIERCATNILNATSL